MDLGLSRTNSKNVIQNIYDAVELFSDSLIFHNLSGVILFHKKVNELHQSEKCLYIFGLFKKFYEFQKRKPDVNEVIGLKNRKILKIIVCKGLTEVEDVLFQVATVLKSERMIFFLFGDPFTINTLRHNIIEALNRYRA